MSESPVAAKTGRKRSRGTLWREALDGYVFILPWMLGFIIWTAGPMVASLVISLTRWEIVTPLQWVGFAQYQKLFQDDRFYLSLYNTAFYVFLGVPIHLFTALLAALAMNLKVHGSRIYRTIYYLPSITPAVANSILWLWIFNPEFGLANAFLGLFGVQPVYWLQDPDWAKPSFIIMSLWSIGGQMVILLAGLQSIPQSLYDACSIDGAGVWARFRYVTLPMLSPTLFFNLIVAIIGAFQVFTQAYVITSGGPENATLFYVLYLYRMAFENFRMGYASALAWVLFLIIMVFTFIQFRLAGIWVFYEGELRK
jgi:multiple sugar transport system permease protein